jgi:hypothetical protein
VPLSVGAELTAALKSVILQSGHAADPSGGLYGKRGVLRKAGGGGQPAGSGVSGDEKGAEATTLGCPTAKARGQWGRGRTDEPAKKHHVAWKTPSGA